MLRRTAGFSLVSAAALFLLACHDAHEAGPVAGPEFSAHSALAPPEAGTQALEEYLPPHTVTRTSGSVQAINIPLDGARYPLFMEPFELHVRAAGVGSAPVMGWVRVDGVQVLGPQDFRTGSAEFVRDVPVTSSSVVSIELAGLPGASVTVSMDAAFQPPPVITVTSPAPDTMLLQSGSQVTISGEACHDRFPITHLAIDGVDVPVSGDQLCESFSLNRPSHWGMNVIQGAVENSRGRTGSLVQAYLSSPQYFRGGSSFNMEDRVPAAIVARLEQSALDDGNPDLNDLAHIADDQMRGLDYASLLPNPLYLNCWDADGPFGNPALAAGVSAGHGAGTPVDPTVDLTASTAGLDLALHIPPTQLYLAASFGWDIGSSCPLSGYDATVSGTVHFGDWTLSGLGTPQSDLLINVSNVTGNLPQVTVDLDAGNIPSVVVNAVDNVTNAIAGGVIAVAQAANVISTVRNGLADIVNRMLQSLATVTPDPVDIGDVAVDYQAGLDGLGFYGPSGNGYAELSGYTQVVPVAPHAVHASPTGSIRGDGAAPTLFHSAANFGVAVKDDAVNQLLWTAWHEGAFDVPDLATLVSGADLSGLSLSLSSGLPPVVMPGQAAGTLDIGVGGLNISATIDPTLFPGASGDAPIHAHLSVTGVLEASPTYDNATNRIHLDGVTVHVFVQIVDIDRPLDESALASRIGDIAAAGVEALLPGAVAAFPMPSITFGTKPQRTLPLVDVTVDRAGNYTRLTGRLGVAQ